MRLHSIRMINSGNFSFANLLLDADSVQLAGRNNKGKTSLLWSLLLLFVVDRKRATHPDYQQKESLHFYFNHPNKSYIIFEGFDEKQGYFYMLLRRDTDTIKYYFVKKKFEENFLIKDNKVLSFQEVKENPLTGIESPLKDISEILAKVITSKTNDIGFLRLVNKTNSRRFSQLYRHLFYVSKNEDDILKNGILVVLGLQDEKLDFGKELGHDEQAKWGKEERELKGLRAVKAQLEPLKEKRNAIGEAKVTLKSILVPYEDINFKSIIEQAKKDRVSKEEEINTLKQDAHSVQELINDETTKEKSFIKTVAQTESDLKQKKKKLENSISYGEAVWVQQELNNATIQRDSIKVILDGLATVSSKEEIDRKLKKTQRELEETEKYITDNANLLLMNISDSEEDLALANALLSEEVKVLHKDNILSSMEPLSSTQFTFNGSNINIESIVPRELPTIEEKKTLLVELKTTLSTLTRMDEQYHQKEELQKEYNAAEIAVNTATNKLTEISHIPKYQEKIAILEERLKQENIILSNYPKQIEILEKKKKKLIDTSIDIANSFEATNKFTREVQTFFADYDSILRKLSINTPASKILPIEELSSLIKKTGSTLNTANDTLVKKEQALEDNISFTKDALRGVSLQGDTPDAFISFLEEKCYGIEEAEENFSAMVSASFNLLFQRVKSFLRQIDTVKTYTHSINRTISKYTISDLSNVQINIDINVEQVNRLKQINSEEVEYSLFNDEEEMIGGDDFFLEYIGKEKVFHLSDLFNITTQREKNKVKEDSKQSNGTERMLHVMLLLILMREMIHKEDTIPFLIDEVMDIDVQNQSQLLSFFKELNLLPISASPHVAHEFDKVYHIEEINSKSYLNTNTATWKVGENTDV